ncbi:Werner syndrome ATP-dependent helicase [Metarhizium anisopliae]|nr:Werner syndrome ATP-dependent helicase [Metarhizium anisopliae]
MGEIAVARMDNAQLMSRIESVIGFRPRTGQVEAIHRLIVDQKDLILIAPTGWGKSIVFQAVPALRGGICIMIMPLTLLEEDQARSISRIPGCNPCILNAGTNSLALLESIRKGAYTHVLLSPELALSETFKTKVLRDPLFQQRLALVAIDEAHVVWEWGESFRTHYSQLVVLRSFIPRVVPWLACSATLDPQTLAKVQELCGFDSSVFIQRNSIDRPDIFIDVKRIMHLLTTFRDLEFLIEPARKAIRDAATQYCESQARAAIAFGDIHSARQLISLGVRQSQNNRILQGVDSRACCMKIRKTVVYFDSIATLEAATVLLTVALISSGCSKTAAANAIQPYHAELATFDKECISREFAKPDNGTAQESSRHRIIMATDAMGMGIDNPDIKLVVQWKQPATLCSLWQRAGRAARGASITGEFIWLVEPWCFEAATPLAGSQGPQGPSQLSKLHNRSLPKELSDVINSQNCTRRSILQFFEDAASYLHPSGPQSCCSLCRGDQPSLQSRVATRLSNTMASQKHIVAAAKAALLRWRKDTAQRWSSILSRDRETLVLPDTILRKLSQAASSIDTVDKLEILVGASWAAWETHAAVVVDLLLGACSEAKAAKAAELNAKKRRALQEIESNSQRRSKKQQGNPVTYKA